ncbi:MAG: electron transporter SenC [Anaerolineaceae bacterium]|nr:electron transporter SenC [Anaerolineaceae bacterium]
MLNQTTSRNNLNNLLIAVAIIAVFITGFAISRLLTTPRPQTVADAPEAPAVTGGAAMVNPPHQLQDFTLTSHTGEAVSLSDFRGKAVLLLFGYTNCPDVCPGTLAEYKRAKRELGAQADDVAFVFVSVDSKRDTPDVIAAYLAQFDADFIGLTGSEEALRTLGAEYGLVFEANTVTVEDHHSEAEAGHDDHEHGHTENIESDNYFVNHTSPSFLIDPDGYLRLLYFVGTRGNTLAAGVQQVLMEHEA